MIEGVVTPFVDVMVFVIESCQFELGDDGVVVQFGCSIGKGNPVKGKHVPPSIKLMDRFVFIE